jgi:hypothetical protein
MTHPYALRRLTAALRNQMSTQAVNARRRQLCGQWTDSFPHRALPFQAERTLRALPAGRRVRDSSGAGASYFRQPPRRAQLVGQSSPAPAARVRRVRLAVALDPSQRLHGREPVQKRGGTCRASQSEGVLRGAARSEPGSNVAGDPITSPRHRPSLSIPEPAERPANTSPQGGRPDAKNFPNGASPMAAPAQRQQQR